MIFLLAFLFLALVLHSSAIIIFFVKLFSRSPSSTASSSVMNTIPVCVGVCVGTVFFFNLVTSAALFLPLLVLHDHTISALCFPSCLHRIKKRLLLAIMFMYFPMSPGHTLNTYMQVPLLNLRVSLLLATFASM